jgi:hypothetical protein
VTHAGQVELFINGEHVGDVDVQRTEGSWAHGNFQPRPAFAKFAPLFGQWSLLMHADAPGEPLNAAAADELRLTEFAIDRLSARLHFVEGDRWLTCWQLNIDGRLIEWKCH